MLCGIAVFFIVALFVFLCACDVASKEDERMDKSKKKGNK
jgi:hypothetical protein